jgi:transposase
LRPAVKPATECFMSDETKTTDGATTTAPSKPKRWSATRKLEVAMRLLRGESLEALSRETGKPAHELAEWRDRAAAGAEESLKARNGAAGGDEVDRRRLQAKLGELTMENELLREKIERLEEGRPFAKRRRSKR